MPSKVVLGWRCVMGQESNGEVGYFSEWNFYESTGS